MKAVRILIADDHEVIRRGLRELLESRPEWEIVGEADTGRDAVEKARRLKPTIVIMDIGMPELNGLEATRRILDRNPQIQVLILSMHESGQLVRDVLPWGARGYLLKGDSAVDLVAAGNRFSRPAVSRPAVAAALYTAAHN